MMYDVCLSVCLLIALLCVIFFLCVCAADVYAFGIILWEILTRQELYEDKEQMQIIVEVVNEGLRPKIPKQFKNSKLLPLIEDCWTQDPKDRPTFKIICQRLEKIAQHYDTKGFDPKKRYPNRNF